MVNPCMWLSVRPVSKQVSVISKSTNFSPTHERCARPKKLLHTWQSETFLKVRSTYIVLEEPPLKFTLVM